MAIKQNVIEKQQGITVPGAYIKFAYLEWNDITKKATASYSVWATPTAEAEGKATLDIIQVDVTSRFATLQRDMYLQIKSLPEFANAVDV